MTIPDQILHLIPDNTLDVIRICAHLDRLIIDQNRRIQDDQPLAPVPLLWLAIAQVAGLQVTIENALVTGSHCAIACAHDAGLVIDIYATNATNTIGRITDGPHAPPLTYSIQAEALQRMSFACHD